MDQYELFERWCIMAEAIGDQNAYTECSRLVNTAGQNWLKQRLKLLKVEVK